MFVLDVCRVFQYKSRQSPVECSQLFRHNLIEAWQLVFDLQHSKTWILHWPTSLPALAGVIVPVIDLFSYCSAITTTFIYFFKSYLILFCIIRNDTILGTENCRKCLTGYWNNNSRNVTIYVSMCNYIIWLGAKIIVDLYLWQIKRLISRFTFHRRTCNQ